MPYSHPVVDALVQRPRTRLATLPTPLERGPVLTGGARLWVKRDDLTGLGAGGNKARKLEFLCGEAVAVGAGALVTVGAAQSNHCRTTAAAGAVLGLPVHLVLSGTRSERLTGNQLLSHLFGAELHMTGAAESDWETLEGARRGVEDGLRAEGMHPFGIPIGGSTPVGALGYLAAFLEIMDQCAATGVRPAAIVVTTSSGGTHAGLVAGRAVWRQLHDTGVVDLPPPAVVAIGVAKGVIADQPDVADLARAALALVDGDDPTVGTTVEAADVEIDPAWMGHDYAEPTAAADDAIVWAARTGAWVLDRVYTGKGMSGLLGHAAQGRWDDQDVIFIHTGGLPSVFTPGGTP